MREQHRRKNFKVGDSCDGFNKRWALHHIRLHAANRDTVKYTFQNSDFRCDSVIIKQSVWLSKLADALCGK